MMRVARRFARRQLLQAFAMGLAAPSLLISSATEIRALDRGETVRHAWQGVGAHLNRAMKRFDNEEASGNKRTKNS